MCSVQELTRQSFLAPLGLWSSTAGLNLLEGLTTTSQFVDAGVDRGGPEKGLRVVVPRRQKFLDRGDQIVAAVKGVPADAFRRQFSTPAFHEVEPTGTGRHNVRNEPRMPVEPGSHRRMGVRAIVVHHQV